MLVPLTVNTIFLLVFMVAMMFFLTSFHVTSDSHQLSPDGTSKIQRGSNRYIIYPGGKDEGNVEKSSKANNGGVSQTGSVTASITSAQSTTKTTATTEVTKKNEVKQASTQTSTKTTVANNENSQSQFERYSIDASSIKNNPTNIDIVNKKLRRCELNFPTTCSINPYIKYWDDYTDCFASPLRKISGSHLPIEQRKYVVFQPDLGGWNNIRMALEVVLVFAFVTGRILVLPPDAILYLLHMNKKWGENKSNMDDFIDFKRLMSSNGMEVISMKEFLTTIAAKNMLSLPLPNNDTDLIKKPLWDYLESACYGRQWSPGKTFVAFNISSDEQGNPIFGMLSDTKSERYTRFAIGREPILYDQSFHEHRAIFFPGHEKNRLLTHFYTMLYFADETYEKMLKRFVRDRLRYLDEIYCTSSRIVDALTTQDDRKQRPKYIAYHIRRGDFQQKHTRLEAETIVQLTLHLVPDHKDRILYISTDENNRTFFEPFVREYKEVHFLSDYYRRFGLDEVNQNHLGMVEQLICAAADVFIGTPLSTFTSYITRLRGYMDRNDIVYDNVIYDRRGSYNRSYYFMKHHMYQIQKKPHLYLPFWVREFSDAFEDIQTDVLPSNVHKLMV